MESQESTTASFRVAKDDLAEAVSWVARSLPTKGTQPVLTAVLLTADDQGLEIAGFDYETSNRMRISAEINENGSVAVSGRLLKNITSVLPNKPVDVQVESGSLVIACGASRFEIPLIPTDDYPQLPKLPELTGRIDPALFSSAVTQVAAAAGRDDALPMLTGVCMEIKGKEVTLAATDRFRLALRKFEWECSDESTTARLLIPAKTLLENAKSLDSSINDPVDVHIGAGEEVGKDGLFGVHTEDRETTTRMLDAEFPNINPLLPKSHTSMAIINIASLQEALRRVSLLAENGAQIRMEFSEGQVILAASSSKEGHAEETLPCVYSGNEDLLIAFNPGYLKDGLGVIRGDNVVFGFNEPSRPAILIPEPEQMPEQNNEGVFDSPQTDFTYLLMPVRLPG